MFDMIAFKCCRTKQKLKECENNFIRNGSLLQEEIIAVCKGKNLPIHVFSANEVTKMSTFTSSDYITKNYHYKIFRGTIDEGNRPVFIKKFHSTFSFVGVEGIFREIVIATQMCMHQNSLKLIGCCLETELLVIVYEFPDQGCLLDIISNTGFFPWKLRLKIGSEISYALAYLQNGFCRPVIFRNLSINDVYLDRDYVTKLTGYDFTVLIPEGEVHVNDAVVGTAGEVHVRTAPEYLTSGRLTEKTDVYCFGVLLLELLVGRNRLTYWYQFHISRKIREHDQNLKISMFVDPEISCEIEESGKQQQLQEVFELAWRCTYRNEDDRPSMIEVASELKKIADSN